jgi:hypothetical protein
LTDAEQHPCPQPTAGDQDAWSNQALFSTEKTASVHVRQLLARLGVAVAAKRSQSLTGSTSTSDYPAAALVPFLRPPR